MGGSLPGGGTPKIPAPPPPPKVPGRPPPPPQKTDQDVQQERRAELERMKMMKGRKSTILDQSGKSGSVGKKTLLGE